MRRLDLKIDGVLMDLPPDFSVAMSYSVNDIGDIAARSADYSASTSLPKTAKNLSVFLGQQYSVLSADIIELGCLVTRATCVVESVTDAINIRLEAGNATFFSKLEDKNLQDLKFYGRYDHAWTLANVKATEEHTWQDVYTYVITNPGTFSDSRSIDDGISQIEVFPALFAKRVFLDLIGSLGYFAKGQFLDTPAFTTLLMDSGNPLRYSSDLTEKYGVLAGITPAQEVQSKENPFGGSGVVIGDLPFNLTTDAFGSPFSDPGNNFNESTYTYTVPQDLVIEATVTIPFRLWAAVLGQNKAVYVATKMYVDDQLYYYLREDYGRTVSLTQKKRQYQRTFPQTLLRAGNEVKFVYEIGRSDNTADFNLVLEFNESTRLEIKAYPYIVPGSTMQINSLLPDLEYKDFLLSMAVAFGLLFIVDEAEKSVTVEKFQAVVDNIKNPVDWTRKIDLSEPPEETFDSENYGQKSIFKWAEVDGYTGEGYLELLNKKLDVTKDVFESKFSATPMIASFSSGFSFASVERFGVGDSKRFSPYSQSETYYSDPDTSYVEYRQRFFKAKENNLLGVAPLIDIPFPVQRTVVSDKWEEIGLVQLLEALGENEAGPRMYYLKQGLQEPVTVTWNGQQVTLKNFADFSQLDFTQLLRTYYAGLGTALYAAKFLRVLIRLKASDIQKLDYTRPVLIHTLHPKEGQRIDGYWYISEVEQYKHGSNESCWVTLLRIVPTVQNELRRAVVSATYTVLTTELLEPILTDQGRYIRV